jgi:hypothetical protein
VVPSCCSRRCSLYCTSQVLGRGAQADARGATQLRDCGEQAVARGAARYLLHLLSRRVKTDTCGRSFAVLSTQVSAAGMCLRRSRLACGSMHEVSRDAVAAGEALLVR